MDITEFGGVLASLTGKSEKEFLNELNQFIQDADEDPDKAKSGISEYLETQFGQKFKSIGQQQLDRGIREGLTALEKKARDKFGVDTDARGLDLIERIVEAQRQTAAKEASPNLEDLSADQLKGLPQVQELVKPWVSKYEETQNAFEQYKTQIEQRNHAQQVRGAIRNEFLKLNPILPKDEAKRQKAVEAFVNSFNPSRFAVTDSGNIKPLFLNLNE